MSSAELAREMKRQFISYRTSNKNCRSLLNNYQKHLATFSKLFSFMQKPTISKGGTTNNNIVKNKFQCTLVTQIKAFSKLDRKWFMSKLELSSTNKQINPQQFIIFLQNERTGNATVNT
jgi:hypothetical protein